MAKKEQSKSSSWKIFLGISVAISVILLLLVIVPIIAIVGALGSASSGPAVSSSGNVAYLPLTGMLLTQGGQDLFSNDAIISSSYVVDVLQQISEDSSVEGIIIEINSPGGSGVASDQIASKIQELEIPVITVVGEVAASGGYWVAASSDYIFANRFSTVGSIGVLGSFLDFSGLLQDYNITYQQFIAGEHKDFGSPFRAPTQSERVKYQILLDELHELFIQEVAVGRGMEIAQVQDLADGFVYSGQQGVVNGLVDEIGDYYSAIAWMERELNQTIEVREYQRPVSFFEALGSFMQPKQPLVIHPLQQALTQQRDLRIMT